MLFRSAKRTRQTLKHIQSQVSLGQIQFRNDLYLSSYRDYLALLWQLDSTNEVLIVGHNFGISDLAGYLLDDNIELRTCEYLCIVFEVEQWLHTSRGTGTITDRYRPSV